MFHTFHLQVTKDNASIIFTINEISAQHPHKVFEKIGENHNKVFPQMVNHDKVFPQMVNHNKVFPFFNRSKTLV